MRNVRPAPVLWLACAALALSLTAARAESEEPPFMQSVYPPDLVMRNARQIELRPEQRQAITKAIQTTQASVVELEWEMQDAAAELTREMDQARIDPTAALAAAERVMSIEGQVKRAHLGLLIQIKNQLDPEQQAKLQAIRDAWPF